MKICVCISDNGKTKNKRLSFLNKMPVLRERERGREREREREREMLVKLILIKKKF